MLLWKKGGRERQEGYSTSVAYNFVMQQIQSSSLLAFLFHHFPQQVFHSRFHSRFFRSRVVFQCFHSCLVSVPFTGPSLHMVNFYSKKFTHSFCCFFATWQQTHSSVPVHVYSISLSRSTVLLFINGYISIHVSVVFHCNWKDTARCRWM